MHLRLKELQRVARQTIQTERRGAALREELTRVLGPAVVSSRDSVGVARAANEQIDILEAKGHHVPRQDFRVSVLLEAATHPSPVVRKLAARLLPERFVGRLLDDNSSAVRSAAASRAPLSLVKGSLRRHPHDDQMHTVFRARRLAEAGLPAPKVADEHFDLHGEAPMGDLAKGYPGEGELSDDWYERLAHKLCSEYGTNLEGQWEEILVKRIVSTHKATSGVHIDQNKLLNAIHDCIEAREEAVLGEGSFKSLVSSLRRGAALQESVAMPVIESPSDPIGELLESSASGTDFLTAAERILSISMGRVPAGIKKYRLGEGFMGDTLVPVKGVVPGGINSRSEKLLDTYVRRWNERQALRGEPYVINWGPHPESINAVGFNIALR